MDRAGEQQLKMSAMSEHNDPPEDIHFRDIAPAIEFVCWVVVVLVPLLRWINGPAVTDDQFLVQCALFGSALLGGVGLRFYQLFCRER